MITGNSESLLIEMVEGDWGEELPLEIESESEITSSDKFIIEIFKDVRSREPIITKKYSDIKENTINFRLTQEESEKLKVGTYYYNNGCTYQGEYRDDIYHGYGKESYTNGGRYEGEFVNGKRHGQGMLDFGDGNRYEGGWVNDQRSGRGRQIFANGEQFVGSFKNNQKNGEGIYLYANGVQEEGVWKDDSKVN